MRYVLARFSTVALMLATGCTSGDQSLPTAPDVVPSYAKPAGTGITVTAFPSLGGNSVANAINDQQVIVGTSNELPAKWTLVAGKWTVEALPGVASGQARDITEAGTIVGSSGGNAILWPPGGDPEIIGPGYAVAVNELDVVVGVRSGEPNEATAWTRSGDGWVAHVLPRQAGVTTGFNIPSDINDDGVIVGYGQDASGTQHAIKWIPSTTSGEWDPAVPVNEQAGSSTSWAEAVAGQDIVGGTWICSTPSQCTSREAYHWSLTAGAGIGSLGAADAWALGLNDQQYIVGSALVGKVVLKLRAFVWSPANPILQDLGILKGYASAQAYDINNPTALRTTKQAVGENTKLGRTGVAVLYTVP
jgi:probable HAF family extracellular repeat protein